MTEDQYKPLIRRVLAEFDFGEMHSVMRAMGWVWFINDERRVPTIGELYQKAEELLIDAAQSGGVLGSGGFSAYCEDGEAGLRFVVTEAFCGLDELEEERHDDESRLL